MWIGHRAEIEGLTFRALALRQSGFALMRGWCSGRRLFNLCVVVGLHCRLH